MAVQVAAHVVQLDRASGSVAVGRGLELAAVLAQLGLDVRQARAARRPPPRSRSAASRRSRRRGSPYSDTCSPRRTAASRSAHVVRLGAGEVLQQVAELVGRDDAQVDLHARVRARPRAPLLAGGRRLSIERRARRAPRPARRVVGRVATMSRSLTLSASRRAEPASSTRSAAGCARSAVGDLLADLERLAAAATRGAGALGDRRARERREHGSPRTSAPKPVHARAAAAPCAASRSASSESMPSSS